ncbi:MAG: aldolase/citrate lyase family protein [Devosia sp.]|nr:aldolase/citrate lyase family protein [Devosia sp.]
MDSFRHRCTAGTAVIGTFAAIPHPAAVEVVAAAGPDFICIDWEHSQVGRERLEDMVRAADLHAVPAIVRVPGHLPDSIAAALDAGAKGVLVPRVSNAAQARAAVNATRYPPLGQRGVGPGRAAGYGYRIPDYLAKANDALLLAVQVETAEGLANIAEIAAVEGIDVIFVGPGDLSVSIGALGPDHKDRLDAAIIAIIDASVRAGRTAGIFRPTPTDIARWIDVGTRFMIIASDAMFLAAAVEETMTRARQTISETG